MSSELYAPQDGPRYDDEPDWMFEQGVTGVVQLCEAGAARLPARLFERFHGPASERIVVALLSAQCARPDCGRRGAGAHCSHIRCGWIT